MVGTYETWSAAAAAGKAAASQVSAACAVPVGVTVACDAGQRIPSPSDSPATAHIIKAEAATQRMLRALAAEEAALVKLGTEHVLTPKGVKATAEAARGLREAGVEVRALEGDTLKARGTATEVETAALEERAARLETKVTQSAGVAHSVLGDSTLVDAAADARAKARFDQEAAALARAAEAAHRTEEARRAASEARANAKAEAERRLQAQRDAVAAAKAEAEQRAQARVDAVAKARADAEAKRLAAAEALKKASLGAAAAKEAEEAKRREEAEKARREAQARAGADLESKIGNDYQAATTTLTRSIDECSASVAQMTMTELQPGASAATKAHAGEVKLLLQNQKDKLRGLLVKVRESKDKPRNAALAAELQAARTQADTLDRETQALVARAKGLH